MAASITTADIKKPTFAALTVELAEADAKARSTSADAGQARADRSAKAVRTIVAAFDEGVPGKVVRENLLAAGVLKGTVSKIVTVLEALAAKELATTDVKSLNGAYNLVKSIRAAMATSGGTVPAVHIPAPAAKPVATPEEALDLIIKTITSEKDPDKAFKLGGDWITKITNAITDALAKIGDDEDEEDE